MFSSESGPISYRVAPTTADRVYYENNDFVVDPPTFWQTAKSRFACLQEQFASFPDHEAIKTFFNCFNIQTVLVGAALINGARYVANASKEVFGVKPETYLLGPCRLVAGIQVPICLYDSVFNVITAVKGTFNEKVDAFLEMSDNIGTVGDAISTFASGLESVGAVAAKSIMWATPLLCVSIGLEAAGIVLSLKAMVETHLVALNLFSKAKLNKNPEDYELEDFDAGMEYLQGRMDNERTFAGKFFRKDKNILAGRLSEIRMEAEGSLASEDVEEQKLGRDLLHETMSALKGRLTKRIISHVVAAVAATTCIVGIIILLAAPGLQPLGFTLLAIGVSMSLVRLAFECYSDRQLTKALSLERNSQPSHSFFPKEKKRKRENNAFMIRAEDFPQSKRPKLIQEKGGAEQSIYGNPILVYGS